MKFQDVKVGDELMKTSRWGYGGGAVRYEKVIVAKVTKTRFTTLDLDDRELQWTKDGYEYPRNRERWSSHGRWLDFITPEILEEMRLENLKRKFMHTVRFLAQHVEKNFNLLTEHQVAMFNKDTKDVLDTITKEVTK